MKPIVPTMEPIERPTPARSGILPVAALLTAVALWGGSFAAMRVCVRVLTPAAVMWLRMISALILLIPVAGRLVPRDYRAGDWKRLVPMVLFQPCLYFLLESNALRLTTSSQAGVISAAVPLMVAVGAWLVLSEAITRQTVFGLVIAVAGVVALTLMTSPGQPAPNPLLGNAMEFLAMICAAANIILVKELSGRYNPWTLTAFQVVAGALFFSPGAASLIHAPAVVWTPRLIGSMIYLGGFVTLGAFGLYNWGMSRISASRASAFINLVPVTAVFFGWVWLGEALSGPQCIAAVATIGGVWISQTELRGLPAEGLSG